MPDPVTALVASSAIGAGSSIFGASAAASAQKDAAARANDTILAQRQQALDAFNKMFGAGKDAIQPFIDTGTDAANRLTSQLPDLTAPIMMDQETLEKTPGYDWLIKQGMRGVTGSNVLRGLSGAQLKGATDFVKGLADTTYKTQFDIANTNKANAFNRLFQTAGMGKDASTSLLNAGVIGGNAILGSGATVGGQLSGNIIGAGNAEAAKDLSIGKSVGDFASGLPYAPYVGNKLYPKGFTGMYGSN